MNKSTKSLKDSLLEKFSPKKQQRLIKDCNSGKKYLKPTHNKNLSHCGSILAKNNEIINTKDESPTLNNKESNSLSETFEASQIEHTVKENQQEKIIDENFLNCLDSLNMPVDLTSKLTENTKNKASQKCEIQTKIIEINKPKQNFGFSIQTCTNFSENSLQISNLEPISINIRTKTPIKRKSSSFVKMLEKSMSESPGGLPIGLDSNFNTINDNKSNDKLAEEALNIKNSLLQELNDFKTMDSKISCDVSQQNSFSYLNNEKFYKEIELNDYKISRNFFDVNKK